MESIFNKTFERVIKLIIKYLRKKKKKCPRCCYFRGTGRDARRAPCTRV